MTEADAIDACAILYHIEGIRNRMNSATLGEFLDDEDMQIHVAGRLTIINSAIDRVDEETRNVSNGEMWAEVRETRNEFVHRHGSVAVDDFYRVLIVTLPKIEVILRKHLAQSAFDCDEIHGRIGRPSLDRDIGTDREKKDRRRR